MRKAILSIFIFFILSCASENSTERFTKTAVDAARIGSLARLTNDGRSIYPVFGPGDSIVFYQRLLVTDVIDTMYFYQQELIKPYGININNGDLYTLGSKKEFPSNRAIAVSDLPKWEGQETIWGVGSPDSTTIAFETVPTGGNIKTHVIYLARGSSVRRLTFGDTSCFIDRFSDTGRYLTAVYGTGPTSILIFDLKNNFMYRIDRSKDDSASVDYMTSFSPDDSMMLFVRSKMEYQWGKDYFGDIWILRFNK